MLAIPPVNKGAQGLVKKSPLKSKAQIISAAIANVANKKRSPDLYQDRRIALHQDRKIEKHLRQRIALHQDRKIEKRLRQRIALHQDNQTAKYLGKGIAVHPQNPPLRLFAHLANREPEQQLRLLLLPSSLDIDNSNLLPQFRASGNNPQP
jgi:hypothetical protein